MFSGHVNTSLIEYGILESNLFSPILYWHSSTIFLNLKLLRRILKSVFFVCLFLLLPLLVTYIYCLKAFTLKLNNFTWICLRVCHLLLFSSSTVTFLFFIILPSFTLKMLFQLMSLNVFFNFIHSAFFFRCSSPRYTGSLLDLF